MISPPLALAVVIKLCESMHSNEIGMVDSMVALKAEDANGNITLRREDLEGDTNIIEWNNERLKEFHAAVGTIRLLPHCDGEICQILITCAEGSGVAVCFTKDFIWDRDFRLISDEEYSDSMLLLSSKIQTLFN